MKPTPFHRVLHHAVVAACLGASWLAAAETPVSIVSSTCLAIPANRTVSVLTAQPLATGQSIVLAVAVDSADASDLAVTGPTGTNWMPLGGHKSEHRDRSVVLLRADAVQPVASGANLSLSFGLVESARSMCVRGMRYASLLPDITATQADGQGQGDALATPTVTGKQPAIDAMAIAAFIFEANPNALTLSGGAISHGGACNVALDLCLRTAHQEGVSGSASISMTPASASHWQATMAVLAAPILFKDGFE